MVPCYVDRKIMGSKLKKRKTIMDKKKEKRSEIIRRGGGMKATSRQISISIRNQAFFFWSLSFFLSVHRICFSPSFHISDLL
jgi:hypothetical protein